MAFERDENLGMEEAGHEAPAFHELIQDSEAAVRATRIWVETTNEDFLSKQKVLEDKERELQALLASVEAGEMRGNVDEYLDILGNSIGKAKEIVQNIELVKARLYDQIALFEEHKKQVGKKSGILDA